MVQEVRSGASGFVCDLSSMAGVAAALVHIRNSGLSHEDKRSLRDLLFLYTNSGSSDTALRTLIESRLHELPLVHQEKATTVSPVVAESVVASTSTPAPQKVALRSGFAGGRPKPSFVAPPVTPVSHSVQPHPATSPQVPKEEPAPVSQVVITPTAPTVGHLDTEAQPKAVVDEKLATVAPDAEPTVTYEPLYREDASVETYRERIAEIKRVVNARVGNPVNLVDIDNTIGREYMTTLLEAMKTVSGGGGDMVSTMNRLEKVVAEVMKLLDTNDVSSKVAQKPLTASEPVSAPAPASTTQPTVIIKPVIPQKSIPAAVNEVVVPQEPAPSPVPPVSPVVSEPEPVVPPVRFESVAEVVTGTDVKGGITEQQGYSVPIKVEEKVEIDPMTIASSRFKNVAPVSQREPLKTPADLPTAGELKARMGIVDPLLDPDVDAGLDQLLSEWSLFKKSGMFGTGPRGRQHPLYIKLSQLTIPLILSGRFEGATPEIKQSVTDYMNGWRYEQGIVHNGDETFEHYLRRVIRHIIDSQTRRRSA